MAESPDVPNTFITTFESRNVGRDNSIARAGRRRKKKKSTKKRGKKNREEKHQEVAVDISITDPMKKLRAAHPRHIIKLILKKLVEKPSFYRMLGSLGMALKSSGVSLEEFLLSNSNKLPRPLHNKMRYDINDQRVLILLRLAIHKMLIREGTTLKSCIHSNGTYPDEYDSDNDDADIQDVPAPFKKLKKGLKYINNQQFAQKMQTENPQEILNALSYADKHKLYELFKQELDANEPATTTELHTYCTQHVSTAPILINNAMPTIMKHDDQTTWPVLQQQETIAPDTFDLELANSNTLNIPNLNDMKMQQSAKSNFSQPSAHSIYEEEYKEEEKQSQLEQALQLQPSQSIPSMQSSVQSLVGLPMDLELEELDPAQMSELQKKEYEAEQAKDRVIQMKREYVKLTDKNDQIMESLVVSKDHDKMMSDTYEYHTVGDGARDIAVRDISLLSSLQTQIDILVRYNHIGYKHLDMLLSNKPSCFPEMYVSLDKMREWELQRENEIEILDDKRLECKQKYGVDIDELNIRKALLAREINESKVSLERIKFELQKLRKLYENAKIELDEVNEVTKQQELQRDAYLTKFDEQWTFEWGVRKKFHKQTKLNEAIKSDARDWVNKLDQIKRYDTSNEIWRALKSDIWKFHHDNKKIAQHYSKLNRVNKSREDMYFGCINFWNNWYFTHTHENGHSDDKKRLSQFYQDILLKGTAKNVYFELNKDLAQFEYAINEKRKTADTDKMWSYRDMIYDEKEVQIDIQQTELPVNELWKLVDYQEKPGGPDMESYKQFAYPKLYKFEQEQLELERRERIREIEKQKQREKQKAGGASNYTKKSKRNLLKMAKKQTMRKLQEVEDEELDREQERKYQSTMQFINQSARNVNADYNSLPDTPGMSGMTGMGMSGRGVDSQFSFNQGTNTNFSNLGMSGKAGGGSFNFGTSKGGFAGMSTASFAMESRQGSVATFGSREDFGRQTTLVTEKQRSSGYYGANSGRYASPTYSKFTSSGYGGTGNTPTGLGTRNSGISASGFGGGVSVASGFGAGGGGVSVGGGGNSTPGGSVQHGGRQQSMSMGMGMGMGMGLSGMGGSFGKFQPMNFGDSPSMHPMQSTYSSVDNLDLANQNSFSVAQKHERL